MSQPWDIDSLLLPISEQQPCGEDIEYTLLPEIDALRVFGHSTPYEQPPEWAKVQARALAAVQKSKDLRALAHLGAALLRTQGLAAFTQTVAAAAGWLETYWSDTYPRVDEDAVLRRNALNYFADPMAIIDGLRRAPLVSSRQHGIFSLRDAEIVGGQIQGASEDVRPDPGQMAAAFAEMPLADLQGLAATVQGTNETLQRIERQMREQGGPDAGPGFDGLSAQVGRIGRLLDAQLAARPDTAPGGVGDDTGEAGIMDDGGARIGGPVRSAQDAIRAIEAAAEFFRRTEPSSPVPLILDRAKRLVSKDFLEVLADIAPEAISSARAAGGLKD